MSDDRPVGIVLSGGASKRMGVDKATLVVDGKPMVVSVADALWEGGCHPVECQGGDATAIGEYGLDVYPDRHAGGGPVPAILLALERHDGCDVVAAACDLADLDGATVHSLVTTLREGSDDVAVASVGGERHLAAAWRSSAAGRLADLVGSGVEAYQEALARLDVVDVEVSAASMRNVNSPADLGEA